MIGDVGAIVLSVGVAAAVLGTLVWLAVTMVRTRPPRTLRRERYLASAGIDWRHVGHAALDAAISGATSFDFASSDEGASSEILGGGGSSAEHSHGGADAPADDSFTCETDD